MENIQSKGEWPHIRWHFFKFKQKILFHIFHIFASFVKKVFNVTCCYNCTPYDKGPSLTAGVSLTSRRFFLNSFCPMYFIAPMLRLNLLYYLPVRCLISYLFVALHTWIWKCIPTVASIISYHVSLLLIDQHDCFKCPNGTWSLKEWTHWKPGGTTVIPLPWCLRQMFEVVLLFIIFIIFLVHKEYLPMKRAEVIGWAISKFCERYLIHRQTEPLCKAWASHCVSPAF